jgi:hypothetical protein
MVGTAARMRVSSVMFMSPSSGTLKSHLTRTVLPVIIIVVVVEEENASRQYKIIIIVVVPGGPFPSSQRYHLPPHL